MRFIIRAIADGAYNFISEAVSKLLWLFVILGLVPCIKYLWSYFRSRGKNRTVIPAENTPTAYSRTEEENSPDPEAIFLEATKQQRKNPKKAAELYRKASNLGHVGAKFCLGNMYMSGRGVKRNCVEALTLYRESADSGNTKAMCAIAKIYKDGRFVERDCGLALAWYQKAVEGGDIEAMYSLAEMYREGAGTEKNNQAAYMLFFLLNLMGGGNKKVNRHLQELSIVLSIEQMNIAEETAREEAEKIRAQSTKQQ